MKKCKSLFLSFVFILSLTLGFANPANAFSCDITPGDFDGHCWTIDITWPSGQTVRSYSCGDVAEDNPADCNKEGDINQD
jgi:hypothetical protein